MADNALTGSIPKTIGHLNQLRCLDLSNNKLSGAIPDELCELCRALLRNRDGGVQSQDREAISMSMSMLVLERKAKATVVDLSCNDYLDELPTDLALALSPHTTAHEHAQKW
jgi:hypothetical protein